MKTPPMKASAPKTPPPKTMKGGGGKPHIRMRKLKPVPPSAFPTGPAAFPTGPMPGPDAAVSAQPGGMPSGAAPGDMGE